MEKSSQDTVLSFVGEGFIRLPRRVVDGMFSEDPVIREIYFLYAALIILSPYAEEYVTVRRHKICCQPGELVTSSRKLAKQTGFSKTNLVRVLDQLEEMGLIETDLIPGGRMIRVVGFRLLTRGRNPKKHRESGRPPGSPGDTPPPVLTPEDQRPPGDSVRRHKARLARRKTACRRE